MGEAVRPSLLLAGNDIAVAKSLVRMLKGNFDVVGVVANGSALIELVGELGPDVVLSDIGLEGLDGIAATIEIRRRYSAIPIVLVTGQDDPSLRPRALAAGASAFVLKHAAESLISVLQDLLRRTDIP